MGSFAGGFAQKLSQRLIGINEQYPGQVYATQISIRNDFLRKATNQHFNGCVLHIAVAAISDDQLAHLRAAMERGRTLEGIQAVVERGKRLKEIQESERMSGSE